MNESTYAWDAQLPCKNPNCRSHGRPHANCKCYGGYAEGGEVSFCSQSRPHEATCEYYADGGDVAPDFDSIQDTSPQPQAALQTQSASNETAPNFDDIQDAGQTQQPSADAPNFDDIQDAHEKYGTLGQQILTGVEGTAQGLAGPFATLAEKGLSKLGVPGLSDEDIAGRAHENSLTHGITEGGALAASMAVPGLGEATLAGNLAKYSAKAAEAAKLGKLGAAALKGFLTTAGVQGFDEASKYLLGQGGNPNDVMGSILAAGTLGAITGGAFHSVGEGLKAAAASKLGESGMDFLRGVGAASSSAGVPEELSQLAHGPSSSAAYRNGIKMIKDILPAAITGSSEGAGLKIGYVLGSKAGVPEAGTLVGDRIGKYMASKLGIPVNSAIRKYVPSLILKLTSEGNPEALGHAVEYGTAIGRGVQNINNGVESLFKAGGQQLINAGAHERDRKRLEEYIDNGGMQTELQQPQGQAPQFAAGGEVQPVNSQSSFLEHNYPDQAMLHSAMRGRVSNYLTSLKPQKDLPKLAFDSAPDHREKRRAYDKALDVAVSPLSVLAHIKKGTIDTEHLKHLNQLYPELVSQLQKKVTEHISQAQLDGSKPSYKVRKGLSMLMGTPLDSTMTPTSIQAAQHVFMQKKQDQQAQQQMAAKKAKKGTASLGKVGPSNMTPEQAREARSQTKS